MPISKILNQNEIIKVDNGGLIRVESDGSLHVTASVVIDGDFSLGNTFWDDLKFPAAGINPPGAASDPGRDTTDGRLSFSASAENIVAIQVQMPHNWKEGSAIYPHFHWSPTNTDTGNVLWQLKYKIANVNGTFPGAWTTLTKLDAGDGTSDQHQIAAFSAIPMTGYTLSCMMLILLSRVGDDGTDTYNAACKLNEFDIHYQIDSFGSDEEYTK